MSKVCMVYICKPIVEVLNNIQFDSPKQEGRAYKFVHMLLEKQLFGDNPSNGFVTLHSSILTKGFGADYFKIIRKLISLDIVECDKSYVRGKFGKGYRIKHDFISRDIKEIKIKYDKITSRSCDSLITKTKGFLRLLKIHKGVDINEYLDSFITPELVEEKIMFLDGYEDPTNYKHEYVIHNGDERKYKTKRYATLAELKKGMKKGEVIYYYNDKLHIICKTKQEIINDEIIKLHYTYAKGLFEIKNRNVYAKRNGTNWRLDTNLTNLKSEFIDILEFEGEKLVSIDLRNSQFVLLGHLTQGLLTNPKLSLPVSTYTSSSDDKCVATCLPTSNTNPTNLYDFPSMLKLSLIRLSYYMYGKLHSDNTNHTNMNVGEMILDATCYEDEWNLDYHFLTYMLGIIDNIKEGKEGLSDCLPGDYKSFIRSVTRGTLYDDILLEENKSRPTGRKLTRGDIKKMMFLVAFSKYRFVNSSKRLFKNIYPTISGFIASFKKGAVKLLESLHCCEITSDQYRMIRKVGNASFAVLLQNIESIIFIDGILKKLLAKGFKVFSKHDSILCKQSDLDEVLQIMTEELDYYLEKGNYKLEWENNVFQENMVKSKID